MAACCVFVWQAAKQSLVACPSLPPPSRLTQAKECVCVDIAHDCHRTSVHLCNQAQVGMRAHTRDDAGASS